jgi:fermentation-respiration switch protein FrsA (DUF1100 family)
MLFIHGGDDTYVPVRMSLLMVEKRKEAGTGPVSFVLIHGASHAKSIIVDPDAWFKAAFEFIDRECGA